MVHPDMKLLPEWVRRMLHAKQPRNTPDAYFIAYQKRLTVGLYSRSHGLAQALASAIGLCFILQKYVRQPFI
jgi:hypothetical protein